MTTYVFPDNTVLINFTLLDRHDIVAWFTRGQGRWTASVWQECGRSATYEGLTQMRQWRSIFGDPIRPTEAEMVDANAIAQQMRKPGESDNRSKHMGEAETIAIIECRYPDTRFLTDDNDAEKRAKSRGIAVHTTMDILAFAEVSGRIANDQAKQCLAVLLNHGQGVGRKAKDYDALVQRYRELLRRS